MDYVLRKVDHLKRIGLVSGSRSGFGPNGGACPDWLVTEKRERAEHLADKAARRRFAQFADDGGWSEAT